MLFGGVMKSVGIHSKNRTPVSGNAISFFWRETKTTYYGYFSRWTFDQPHHLKGIGESFPLMWLNAGLS